MYEQSTTFLNALENHEKFLVNLNYSLSYDFFNFKENLF